MKESFLTSSSEELGSARAQPHQHIVKLEPEMVRARNTLFGIFVCYIVFQALVITLSPDIPGVVRMILTLLLMYFVMSGHSWAKWTMIVLFYFGASLALVDAYDSYATSPSMAIIGVAFATLFVSIGTFLLLSKPLNKYFLFKKERSAP